MLRLTAVLLPIIGMGGSTWAATYEVTNRTNSGAGSLRQAILNANAHPGGDRITFAAGLSGKTIAPTSPLPNITDNYTEVDGDLNDDGKPDIALSGASLSSGAGLTVRNARSCEIVGLAIVRCPDTGLRLESAHQAGVRACFFGVALSGDRALPNGENAGAAGEQVELLNTDGAWIYQMVVEDRNCFHCGTASTGSVGLRLMGSQDNLILGNFFGLAPDGTSAWSDQNCGVELLPSPGGRPSLGNSIGANITTDANYFAGCRFGVRLDRARDNDVCGNCFGLALDGSTALPITNTCVVLGENATNNRVGGSPSQRNVFVCRTVGVYIKGPNASGTEIQGNYFGTNAPGTLQRVMGTCVRTNPGVGALQIGGAAASKRNYLVPNGTAWSVGVQLSHSGDGQRIEGNWFGRLPNGDNGSMAVAAIWSLGSSPLIQGNLISRARSGLIVEDSSSNPRVYLNRFEDCLEAVDLFAGTYCRLGNLSNASSDDDGGNVFRGIGNWFVHNDTAHAVRAEGNDFGTTSRAAINEKIYDHLDDGSLGRVDFDPLMGGVSPTGQTGPAIVNGAAAIPTGTGGAEVVFSLSAPAEVSVTVLNIAGRPIATIMQDRATEGGLQRVSWNGHSATGTRAPGGPYLVRVEARAAQGHTSRALARLTLGR
jgi:hypothetical protein